MTRLEVQAFLRALDRSADFRGGLVSQYPREIHALDSFRRRMGDKCVYIRNIAKRIQAAEVARVGPGWTQDLRAAASA